MESKIGTGFSLFKLSLALLFFGGRVGLFVILSI